MSRKERKETYQDPGDKYNRDRKKVARRAYHSGFSIDRQKFIQKAEKKAQGVLMQTIEELRDLPPEDRWRPMIEILKGTGALKQSNIVIERKGVGDMTDAELEAFLDVGKKAACENSGQSAGGKSGMGKETDSCENQEGTALVAEELHQDPRPVVGGERSEIPIQPISSLLVS